MALVERVVLMSVVNPEVPVGLDKTIPKSAILIRGDRVKLSPKLAKRWDERNITIDPAILEQPENELYAAKLEEFGTVRNPAIRAKNNGMVLTHSRERPAPPARAAEPAKKTSDAGASANAKE